jgi:predicted transcriptional regulator
MRNIGEAVRMARRRSGLSQRDLGERTGVPQSTIARIESGFVDPRTSTIVKLLSACGEELEVLPRLGDGVDRTLIRPLLELTPAQRLARAEADANNLNAFLASVRR